MKATQRQRQLRRRGSGSPGAGAVLGAPRHGQRSATSALPSRVSPSTARIMEDVRKILVPAAIGVAAAVTTLYGVGVFTILAATTSGGPSSAAPPRPPPPRGSAAAEAAGRKRAGTGLPGDSASGVRSTTSSGVGEPGGGAAVYESSKAVDEYLLFHYGKVCARSGPTCAAIRA